MKTIGEGCHYYQFRHADGAGAQLEVLSGSVRYRVYKGAADANGDLCVDATVLATAKVEVSVPILSELLIYSLFIEGLKPGTKYRLSTGNADLLSRDMKDLNDLTKEDVTKGNRIYQHQTFS